MVAPRKAVTERSVLASSGSEAEASKTGCRKVATPDSPGGATQKRKLSEERGRAMR
jgi:hypothetical protein